MIRWRFYREHKFVLAMTAGLEQLIARCDFTDHKHVDVVEKKLEEIIALLQGHAQYENEAIHALLRAKKSKIYQKIEADHEEYEHVFAALREKLARINASSFPEDRLQLGYDFYLSYREFEAANLQHVNEEERVIMPELQRLYTDDELSAVEKKGAYAEMTAEEMGHMVQTLFPHMSPDDHQQFLRDIQEAEPKKFESVLRSVSSTLMPGFK